MRYRTAAAMLLATLLVGAGGAALAQPLAAGAQTSAAQPVAETDASALGRRILTTASEGDATFLAFIHEADPKSRRPDAEWLDLRQRILRTLQLHRLEQASATHAEFSVFDPIVDAWARLTVDITDAKPHTLTNLSVLLGRPPSDIPPTPKLAPPASAAATRERMAALVRDDRFSGAVFVARNGKTLLDQAYGLADREARTPNTADTQFRFGSMGKMFTAVSIMQLAQAGKLDLTAPIGRYLEGYPNADIASTVTIDNLLTHSGGTGDIFTPEYFAKRLEVRDTKDYVALFGARGPQFAPGDRAEYSNYGFMLLGRIVEVVSGQSYDDYIASHIFAPAHMTATGNKPETVRLPRRATGYLIRGGQLVSAADTLPWRGTPAGGGYSTVGDLARFADALMANRLLDAAHTKLLTTGGITAPNGQFLRYDFGAAASDGRRFFGHGGGAPGMNGDLRIFPAEPGHDAYTVVVLANRDPPVAGVLANFISDRLP
jgi:CubicO group peptidase (beta-lactamase class C family)